MEMTPYNSMTIPFPSTSVGLCFFPVVPRKLRPLKSPGLMHSHEHFQLWYTIDGTFDIRFDDRTIHLTSGSVILVPPFVLHGISTPSEREAFAYSVDFFPSALDEITETRGKTLIHNHDCGVILNKIRLSEITVLQDGQKDLADSLVLSMADEFERHADMSVAAMTCSLYSLLLLLKDELAVDMSDRRMENIYSDTRQIEQTLKFARKNLKKKVTVFDACSVAMMSKTSFNKIFSDIAGMPFHEYLLLKRLNKVDKLLPMDLTFDYIAQITGSSSAPHLFYAYSKRFCTTPGTMKKERVRWLNECSSKQLDESFFDDFSWVFDENFENRDSRSFLQHILSHDF